MFQQVTNKINFPALEEKILQFWEQEAIFQKSVERNPASSTYFFYDGPPFATGLPHYGHILAGTIKDVIPRYQTMCGKKVERRFGWDCHGLPVEFEVEKELGLKGSADINSMGINAFNEKCRSIVLRYTNEWEKTVQRMGRWVDLKNHYKTMDLSFMESIWWVFKTLWEKNLIYESGKIVPYSNRLETPLSNFEVNLGYREVQDPSIIVKFPLVDEDNTYFLAWTTTPWTLPSNLALTVSPDLTYVKIKSDHSYYYLAEVLLPKIFPDAEIEIITKISGQKLEGVSYQPLFSYFADYANQGAFRITLGDYIDVETGTGIVHTAPMFGEDDYRTGQKYQLPELLPMNTKGEFDESVVDFAGMYFKDADSYIIKKLKSAGKIFHQSTIVHNYPFCWRSNTPLMYRSIRTWFLNVTTLKEQMIANNQNINWKPEHIQNGRMGKWLEGARDWAISRNRFWGTPIPIWICDSCNHRHCVGSREELEKMTKTTVTDLHRHFIDQLTIQCPQCGASMQRTPEILDCWFESGSMPYGQKHYPFENQSEFDNSFPADFISEGLDQTRGWFYTLNVLSTALFNKPAFKNCIVNGMLLAEDGKKMSKSLKNYPDPWDMIHQYGADAIRLYMLSSGAIRADELRFSEKGLQNVLKNIMIPLWNVLSFFTTYANIDQWEPTHVPYYLQNLHNSLDQWIISCLHHLSLDVQTALDQYDLNKAVAPFLGFIGMLTNWYVRRSRRRFWKAEQGSDKQEAYATLYFILMELSKIIAPFLPYLAENIYQILHTQNDPQSVHLCNFPASDAKYINPDLEEKMEIILTTVNMGRALRAKEEIRIRQPLQKITLVTKKEAIQGTLDEMADLIKDELNVKEVYLANNDEHLVTLSAKPNLPVLGPKLGKKMKIARQAIENLTSQEISQIEQGTTINLDLDDEKLAISQNEIIIQRTEKSGLLVASEKEVTIALDIQLSTDLIAEGYARDFVNKVQITRKERDYDVTDRIVIRFNTNPELAEYLQKFAYYIQQETLADSFVAVPKSDSNFLVWDFNGITCAVIIEKLD